jgi:hypothetical protein
MIQPSLQIGGGDWAVKETKLLGTNPVLNEKLPVEIDVTNATIGARVNKQGIIENGPRNLVTFSETFDNAVWVKNDTVVLSTNNVNPFGKLNATSLGFTLQNNPNFQQTIVTVPNKVFTTSFYVRRVSGTAIIYLRAGNLTQNNINPTSVWQRFSVTGTSDSTIGRCAIGAVTPVIGVDVIEIWGAQLEESSVATEYYPTTTRTNLARIDYSSGEAALLIEPQRTNLLLQSEALTNSTFFTSIRCTVTNVPVLNPANVLISTELRLFNATTDDQHFRINPNATYNSGVTYSYSIFVKYGSFRFCKLAYMNFSGGYVVAVFDLVNGVLGTTAVSGTNSILNNSSIQSLKNGWFRISISATLDSSAGQPMNFEFNKVTSANPSFVGYGRESQTTTTNDFCYLFGAQLEQGFYATSYIPTLASAVTRNADLVSKTGIGNLINSQEGVLFVESKAFVDNASTGLSQGCTISLSDGTNSNFISFYYHGNSINRVVPRITVNGVSVWVGESAIPSATSMNKFAIRWSASEASFWMNGVKINFSSITTATFASNTLTRFGFDPNSTSQVYSFNARTKGLSVYKTALTDSEMIELTTL